jgi:hypothetical protein
MKHPSRILLAAAVVAFAAWVLYSLMMVEPVRVIETHLRHENGRTYVEGRIENTGAADAAVNLEVHYYNSAGRRVADETIVFDKLGKGAMKSFSTKPRPLEGVADFSVALSHGPNPYGN